MQVWDIAKIDILAFVVLNPYWKKYMAIYGLLTVD